MNDELLQIAYDTARDRFIEEERERRIAARLAREAEEKEED